MSKTWTDDQGCERGVCLCGMEVSTHEGAGQLSLDYCGDCNAVTCGDCRVQAGKALRCTDCAAPAAARFPIKASQFKAVWNALAQWADNESSNEDEETPAAEIAQRKIVEAVVERMEAIIVSVIEPAPVEAPAPGWTDKDGRVYREMGKGEVKAIQEEVRVAMKEKFGRGTLRVDGAWRWMSPQMRAMAVDSYAARRVSSQMPAQAAKVSLQYGVDVVRACSAAFPDEEID